MSKISLNSGDSIVTKNQNGMKGIPVDYRAQVQYYKDIQNIEYAYENLQVIVTDDDPTDSQHPKGIYVITKLDANNDVDPSGIKSLKQTVNVTKQDVGLENVDNVKQVPQTRTINNKPLNADVTLNANDVGAIDVNQKGANGGVAELDNNGKLKSAQIPTTVATMDGLNQKVDKVSNAEGNLPKINSNGNLENSGFSIPTTENSNQILGYDSTLPGKLKWINKPFDGQNGDSAYKIWLDVNQHQSTDPGYSETDFLNSLKAHIGNFHYENTDADVVSHITDIGDAVSNINNIIPGDGNNGTNNTLDVIVLMNNGDTTTPKTMMFSTSGDSTNGYKFYYVGDLQSAMPNNVLTQANIVNNLTTGGINDVASAETVKDIAELVEINNDYSIVSYEVKKSLYVSSGGVITNAGAVYFYIGYIPSVNINRKIHIIVSDKSSNTGDYAKPVRGVFFVDDVSEIVNGTTVTYLIEPSTTKQVSLDVEINVPANKILCVSYYKDAYNNQELATYEDIGNPSSKIKEAIGNISESLDIEYTKGEELQHTVYNVLLKYDDVIYSLSSSSSGRTYVYAASNEDRKIYIEQYFNATYQSYFAAVFLIDNVSELVDGTFISYSNILIVPRRNISGLVNDTIITVPAGKILCITTVEDSDNYCKVYEAILQSNEFESLNTKIGDLQDLETTTNTSLVASINEVAESMYANITSSLSPTKILGRRLTNDTTIKSATEGVWNIAYFAARQEEWKANIVANNIDSSIPVGAVVLVDAVTDLDIDDTVSPIINSHPANPGGTRWSMDVVVKVPAGKILAVFEIHFNAHVFDYKEVIGKVEKTQELEERQQELDNIVGNPDYVSENPLDITKETAGYTAIFRTMGVIGGSMSSGAIIPPGTSPQYSQIQYIARLCGSEGHNFGRGGMSARDWPKSDMIEAVDEFKANPMQMYIIQLGNNDSAYNINHPEYVIGEVSQVNGIDGNGTVPDVVNVGSVPTTTYPNYVDTFCGQIGKVLACIRRVSPKAHVFLSTFLRGYGSNQNFLYNQAIRNIYAYLSDSNNRPSGDALKYHLLDYETYGTPFSSYLNDSDTIHKGTVASDHLMATSYLLWSYEYCTYIDWIIKNNMSDFNDVASIAMKIVYNLDNVTIDSVTVNGVSLNTDYLPNYVPYQSTLVLHLTASTSINSVIVYDGNGHAGSDITSSTWDGTTQTITISSVEDLITITAKGS